MPASATSSPKAQAMPNWTTKISTQRQTPTPHERQKLVRLLLRCSKHGDVRIVFDLRSTDPIVRIVKTHSPPLRKRMVISDSSGVSRTLDTSRAVVTGWPSIPSPEARPVASAGATIERRMPAYPFGFLHHVCDSTREIARAYEHVRGVKLVPSFPPPSTWASPELTSFLLGESDGFNLGGLSISEWTTCA